MRHPASKSIDGLTSTNDVDGYLDTGKAWMALDIPTGYGERIRAGRPTTVQVVADGTDANSTNVALGYAGTLVSSYARELAAPSGQLPSHPSCPPTSASGSTRSSRARTS